MALPCRIGDYTDFYTGIHHATTVGKLFRPDNPLLPNYKWVPIGYHGRASSHRRQRPALQRPHGADRRRRTATRRASARRQRLDYELELGVFVGPRQRAGRADADRRRPRTHLFGVVLLNDWSARDIQAWEYQPLGPFLSKNFATTHLAVDRDAARRWRRSARPSSGPTGDPQPLPYLDCGAQPRARRDRHRARGAGCRPRRCATTAQPPRALSAVELPRRLLDAWRSWWRTTRSNGCNLQTGDLLGTGTLSGPQPGQGGSLLELTQGGKQPLTLPDGETRTFLEDGDRVILRAHCERAGRAPHRLRRVQRHGAAGRPG